MSQTKLENEYELFEINEFSVECIGEKEEWVYDIEVEDNHNFFGNDILLHNSVYIEAKTKNLYDILEEGKKLMELLNTSYNAFVKERNGEECSLEIEFEKIFDSILFVSKKGEESGAKKKYAYLPLWVEGKTSVDEIEYTGFETVRSDTPRIAREVQKKVLEMILYDNKKEDVIEYLKSVYKEIINREIPDEEIGIPTKIKANLLNYKSVGPIIKGAMYSNKYLGTRFGQGNKPKFLYVKTVPQGYPDTKVLTFDEKLPDGFIPDWDKVTTRIFKNKLQEIFKAVGWGDFPDLEAKHTGLSTWGLK